MKKILIIIVSFLLIIGSIASFGHIIKNHREEDTLVRTQIAEMREQVAPYEAELASLQTEIRKKEEWTMEKVLSPQVMVGFMPYVAEHIEKIEQFSKEHSFYPIIVLDPSVGDEAAQQILEEAQSKNYEIVLTEMLDRKNPDFSQVEYVRSLLPQYGFCENVIYLLRSDCDTPVVRQKAIELNYSGLLVYDDVNFENGFYKNQIPFGDYYYLRSNSGLHEILYKIVYSHAVAMLIVDFNSIDNGTTRESEIPTILDYLEHLNEKRDIEFSTVKNAFDIIVETDRITKERQQEYETFLEDIQPRISEVQSQLKELYAGFVN